MELTTLSLSFWYVDMLTTLNGVSSMFAWVFGILFLSALLVAVMERPLTRTEKIVYTSLSSSSFFLMMFFTSIAVIVPNKDTMNKIIAIESANYVVKTEEAQQIKDKLLNKVNKLLEE